MEPLGHDENKRGKNKNMLIYVYNFYSIPLCNYWRFCVTEVCKLLRFIHLMLATTHLKALIGITFLLTPMALLETRLQYNFWTMSISNNDGLTHSLRLSVTLNCVRRHRIMDKGNNDILILASRVENMTAEKPNIFDGIYKVSLWIMR